jgi:hypothetical protein
MRSTKSSTISVEKVSYLVFFIFLQIMTLECNIVVKQADEMDNGYPL